MKNMADAALEAFFSRIPLNDDTTNIWDNLMFLPSFSETPAMSDFISSRSLENPGIFQNIFLIKQIHESDIHKILGFLLLEYAFLSPKYPEYFLEVVEDMRYNENNQANNETILILTSFFEFLSLVYFWKKKSQEARNIEKKLQDLFNKSECFNLGCGLFLKGFLRSFGGKSGKIQKMKENLSWNNENLLPFINNFIDFSIFTEKNMYFVIDLQREIAGNCCISKEFSPTYLLYSKEFISLLFNESYQDNDDSRDLSLKLQKQLSLSYKKQTSSMGNKGFSEKKGKKPEFQAKKSQKSCENDQCQQDLPEICFINPSCNHHFCDNCLENLALGKEKTIFCLKNYCFATINPDNLADFFGKNYEFMNEAANKRVKSCNFSAEIGNIKENIEYFCENPSCQRKKTDKMLRNEACGHSFCEDCVAFIAKGGFICLKNYCFAKWSEQFLKEFVGNPLENQGKEENFSFTMQNFSWIKGIPN